jgi:hypothetical protein
LACRLTLEVKQAVVKLPQYQRPGLGRRMEEAAYDLLAGLVDAQHVKADTKAAALKRGSQALDTPRPLLRMAHDLEHLPTKRYEELSRMMGEVGRMLGGWRKSAG